MRSSQCRGALAVPLSRFELIYPAWLTLSLCLARPHHGQKRMDGSGSLCIPSILATVIFRRCALRVHSTQQSGGGTTSSLERTGGSLGSDALPWGASHPPRFEYALFVISPPVAQFGSFYLRLRVATIPWYFTPPANLFASAMAMASLLFFAHTDIVRVIFIDTSHGNRPPDVEHCAEAQPGLASAVATVADFRLLIGLI
jgi:hypothetical protein